MPRRLMALIFVAALSIGGAARAQEEIWDPLEPVNRAVFKFNDYFDIYLGEPVARGYTKVLPQPVRTGVTNFFYNLSYPTYLVSNLLQLKFVPAAEQTGRFVINSTLGLAGFIDVAKKFGLEHHSQDLGLAFASWGVPAGPYVVIPIIGPSTLRDATGLGLQVFLSPWFWLSQSGWTDEWLGYSIAALEYVDIRARLLEAVEAGKASSLDYYLFSQSAYYQYREGLLEGREVSKEDEWLQEAESEEASDEDEWLEGEAD